MLLCYVKVLDQTHIEEKQLHILFGFYIQYIYKLVTAHL